jgi:hypothetical protein
MHSNWIPASFNNHSFTLTPRGGMTEGLASSKRGHKVSRLMECNERRHVKDFDQTQRIQQFALYNVILNLFI